MKIINDFNLFRQAKELGVKVWQTPAFLFIMMGAMTISIMTATYFISKNYDDPQLLIIIESLVAAIIFVVGTSVIRLVEQMQKLNRMKSEFVSVASHQLRTPLAGMKWETELLLSKLKEGLNEKQKEKIENVAMLNRKMIRLVDDLLDVARIDQNRMVLRIEAFNFENLVKESSREIFSSDDPRKIKFNLKMEENLPCAFGDPGRVKLIIDNLLTNALKYTPSGGRVEVKVSSDKHFLFFEVKDNGVGIPQEQLGRVFERFFRSDNAVKYQTEGTGLGLYIAKNTVEQLGGKIWFQSIENVGSVFSFTLPAYIPKLDKKLSSKSLGAACSNYGK